MLVMKDDNLGMADLAEYILHKEPSDTEIMIWLGDYMDERQKSHKETRISP